MMMALAAEGSAGPPPFGEAGAGAGGGGTGACWASAAVANKVAAVESRTGRIHAELDDNVITPSCKRRLPQPTPTLPGLLVRLLRRATAEGARWPVGREVIKIGTNRCNNRNTEVSS